MKAVIPAAGCGSRLRPLTRTISKEMILINNKPVIEYIIQEASIAGIKEFIVVVNKNKKDLIHYLSKFAKSHPDFTLNLAYQEKPLGLGHAIYCAKEYIDSAFAVLLPDNVLSSSTSAPLTAMLKQYNATSKSIILIMPVAKNEIRNYGIVDVNFDGNLMQIKRLVEKPEPQNSPSNLGILGRYILTPEIFPILEKIEKGHGGEIQLTDAIDILARQQPVYAYKFKDAYHDCGNVQGLLVCMKNYKMDFKKIPRYYNFLRELLKKVA